MRVKVFKSALDKAYTTVSKGKHGKKPWSTASRTEAKRKMQYKKKKTKKKK